jgi:hypothetical protein
MWNRGISAAYIVDVTMRRSILLRIPWIGGADCAKKTAFYAVIAFIRGFAPKICIIPHARQFDGVASRLLVFGQAAAAYAPGHP